MRENNLGKEKNRYGLSIVPVLNIKLGSLLCSVFLASLKLDAHADIDLVVYKLHAELAALF